LGSWSPVVGENRGSQVDQGPRECREIMEKRRNSREREFLREKGVLEGEEKRRERNSRESHRVEIIHLSTPPP
jgi:hypothetical protein